MIYDEQNDLSHDNLFKLTNYMLPLTEIKIDKTFSKQLSLVKYCPLSAEFTMNELPMKHQSKMFLKIL